MTKVCNELLFDGLLVIAAGIAFTSYMLGLFLDPTYGFVVAIVLLAGGHLVVVPREKAGIAASIGLLTVGLAGAVVPRFIVGFTGTTAELTVSLLLSGVILLLAVALLHITTFRRRPLDA